MIRSVLSQLEVDDVIHTLPTLISFSEALSLLIDLNPKDILLSRP